MLRSSLCDYADAYILIRVTIIIAVNEGPEPDPDPPRTAAQLLAARQEDERNEGVILKNCALFIKCISEINNTEIDNAQDIDIVMSMYNLIEYSENYSEVSGKLRQCYKDEPNNNLADSESFKSKVKITGSTPTDGNIRDVEITVPLKYLRNFWRSLEMPLINCEVILLLTWSSTCVITNSTGKEKFAINHTKLYVTLSTQDNAKSLQQLKSRFKRTVNWNKSQSDLKTYEQNRYLNHLFNPSFQGVNRIFVLSFENEADRTSHSTYYLPKVEIKDYNVMIDGKNFFDQPINSKHKTYENIRKIATGQGDDYTEMITQLVVCQIILISKKL